MTFNILENLNPAASCSHISLALPNHGLFSAFFDFDAELEPYLLALDEQVVHLKQATLL